MGLGRTLGVVVTEVVTEGVEAGELAGVPLPSGEALTLRPGLGLPLGKLGKLVRVGVCRCDEPTVIPDEPGKEEALAASCDTGAAAAARAPPAEMGGTSSETGIGGSIRPRMIRPAETSTVPTATAAFSFLVKRCTTLASRHHMEADGNDDNYRSPLMCPISRKIRQQAGRGDGDAPRETGLRGGYGRRHGWWPAGTAY